MNDNPWRKLPHQPPYVLPEELEQVLAFNAKQQRKAHRMHVLQYDMLPEPFIGRPDAPVLILGNNPGVRSDEAASLRKTPVFMKRMRANLEHQLPDDYPFLYLDPDPGITPLGKAWWERKLDSLLQLLGGGDTGKSALAKSLLAVEFFPYVSHRFRHERLKLPSQEYSFGLVRRAMERKAIVILTRGVRRWLARIPELEEYPGLVRLKEVQRAPISRNNCCGEGFDLIAKALTTVRD